MGDYNDEGFVSAEDDNEEDNEEDEFAENFTSKGVTVKPLETPLETVKPLATPLVATPLLTATPLAATPLVAKPIEKELEKLNNEDLLQLKLFVTNTQTRSDIVDILEFLEIKYSCEFIKLKEHLVVI